MSPASILILAVGLAMDATAVAASRGLMAARVRARDVALIAALFGGAQTAMPLLGWAVGARLGGHVAAWDHWIAFALLAGLGGRMLWHARAGDDGATRGGDAFGLRPLGVLAIATSVDALAVGTTLPVLGAPLLASIATIGLVTAALSALGVFAGRRFGALLGRRLDAVGGVALIAIGAHILVDHLGA